MERVLENLEQFKEQVAKTFAGLNYGLRPRPPYVLVRVIPKEQSINLGGGKVLFLPDVDGKRQQKPTYEGQVLRVYEPYWKQFQRTVDAEGNLRKWQVQVKCELKPGDHVVFSHFEGIPVPALCHDWKKGDYRLLRDDCIFGVLEYEQLSTIARIQTVLYHAYGDYEFEEDRFVTDLLEQADVIFHEQSKTLSGQ